MRPHQLRHPFTQFARCFNLDRWRPDWYYLGQKILLGGGKKEMDSYNPWLEKGSLVLGLPFKNQNFHLAGNRKQNPHLGGSTTQRLHRTWHLYSLQN
jgi:hypothetical protein